jgi:hypothetical protein
MEYKLGGQEGYPIDKAGYDYKSYTTKYIHVPNISPTLPHSHTVSDVNNESVTDGQTGEKPKV